MKIIHSISEFHCSHKTIVTIGTFDGVHVGHQKILKNLIETAKESGNKSVLLTFFPHPRMVLQKEMDLYLLNTIEEKSLLLNEMGLDYLIIHPFSKDFSRLTAIDFVREFLVKKLNTYQLIIGYDHHFGKNREGNIDQLKEYSLLYDFDVEEIPSQDIDQVSVSSTKIRNALLSGNLKTANAFLGYNFMLNGKVIRGKNVGSKIGFPTANIEIKESYKLIPKTGVYVVKTTVDNIVFYGMMNIGFRPTLGGKEKTIEVHLFNFQKDLYDETISVKLLYFLRNEKKFDNVKMLANQLAVDKKNAISYVSNNLS